MVCSFASLARRAASAVLLISIMPQVVNASDCSCRESRRFHRQLHWSASQREADHGLIRYPNATYWWSGDNKEEWRDAETPPSGSTRIAPSPWSYHSIAPFASQYHFFYVSSYDGDEPHDCRN